MDRTGICLRKRFIFLKVVKVGNLRADLILFVRYIFISGIMD